MYISGGDIYVNAEADGLDANGNIIISGGNIEVWGAKTNTDGAFVDYDGTMSISGATFFAGGNKGMIQPDQISNSQGKLNGEYSVSANYYVNVLSGSTTIKSYSAPKNVAYLYYTSPNVDSTYKFDISSTSSSTPSNEESDTTSKDSSDSSSESDEDFDVYKAKGNSVKNNIYIAIILLILSVNF